MKVSPSVKQRKIGHALKQSRVNPLGKALKAQENLLRGTRRRQTKYLTGLRRSMCRHSFILVSKMKAQGKAPSIYDLVLKQLECYIPEFSTSC
ncbi:hypothetical protein NDU88_000477 [Pleurodeles waltl]|uniref:Uncharacterized protein n=1 Tax=Pleurodeles waltl TaxID=8319 RepID=A0AAV7UR54_PLEWA|nr:hypothetical protein NDU88_000477 [Pleurodeles waltl]